MAFSRQSTFTLSWFSLILLRVKSCFSIFKTNQDPEQYLASLLFLAARLFFLRRSQYFASCGGCGGWFESAAVDIAAAPAAESEVGSDSDSEPTGLNSGKFETRVPRLFLCGPNVNFNLQKRGPESPVRIQKRAGTTSFSRKAGHRFACKMQREEEKGQKVHINGGKGKPFLVLGYEKLMLRQF